MNATGKTEISPLYSVTDLVQTGRRLGEATRLHVGSVYSTNFDGVRLRRRETTLARDLEFVRVYDTTNGRVTASYPESAPYFHACAPYCLLVKERNGQTKRILWQAIASQLPQTKDQSEPNLSAATTETRPAEGKWLRCVVETTQDDVRGAPTPQKANSVETIGDVSCLESIVLDGKVFLLAAYKNGMLAAYTHDLRIANAPMADAMMGEDIKFMATIDTKRATAGILKSVSNLQAALNGTRLLVLLSQPTRSKALAQCRLRVLQLSTNMSDPDRPTAVALLSHDLTLDHSMKRGFECVLDDQGRIYLWADKTLQIFDLSEDLNEPYRNLQFEDDVVSALRLDQHSIAVCTTRSFDRINLQFISSQGKFDWPEPLRISDIKNQYETKLIDHDRKTGRILCLHESKIITISANGKTPVTIADFVNRGLNQSSVTAKYQLSAYQSYLSKNPSGETTWNEWTAHTLSLSDCVKNNDTQGFDAIFGKLLKYVTSSSETKAFEGISLSPSQRLNNDGKFSLVICYLFEPIYDHDYENQNLRIEVKILPRKTCYWLIKNGYITSHNIQHSFRRIGRLSSQSIAEDAVVKALATFDASLADLEYYVTHNNTLTAAEAAAAVACAIALGAEPVTTNVLAIESGQVMDIDEDPETAVDRTTLNDTSNYTADSKSSSLLRVAVLRLIDKDHTVIIKALRQQLTNQQLFGMINYLGIEMSEQGWFAQVLGDDAYTGKDPKDEATTITRMAKILGCVLDALGMTPWLNSATSVENENLISWMKHGISAALEAVEEASYMAGILHEVSLFTKLLSYSDKERLPSNPQRIEPKIIDGLQLGSSALPAGLKPAGWIDVNVVKGGKVQKMSSRQIGQMKSKMVGAYSRERIDLNDFYQPPMQKRKRKS